MFVYQWIPSPVGRLKLIASDTHLLAILWENEKPNRVLLGDMQQVNRHPILDEVKQQLAAYFAGARQQFDVPLFFYGTDFQKQVWNALLNINYGTTCAYMDIAQAINNPKAIRAVGTAIGRNPVSIICPCHRVIGRNGTLTGFAGGLANKHMLLQLEQQYL